MNIEALNEIVKQMDLEKIQTDLEQLGYRHASKNGKWEFSPFDIAKAGEVENTERHEDVFADKVYVGDLHTQVEGQGEYEFIVVTVEEIHRHLNNREFPCEMLLFTNAPIDEEYEREQAKPARCQVCKKEYAQGELTKVNGRLVCKECFEQDLSRLISTGKSRLTKKIKRK